MRVDFSKLPDVINTRYYPYLFDDTFFNLFYGSAGSGKSVFAAQRDVYRSVMFPGLNSVILRKFSATNNKSTIPEIKKIISQWNLNDAFDFVMSPVPRCRCKNGSEILFTGLDDSEKVKSIAFESGPLHQVRCEEMTEFTESDIDQLVFRLRGESDYPFQITGTFNPISAYHWIKARFFDVKSDDVKILKTTYKDNRWIDQATRERFESYKEKNPLYYQVYVLGEWGTPEGLIYPNATESAIPQNARFLGYGLDFGYTNHPTALVGVHELDGELWLDEVIYKTGLTNPEICNIMKSEGITLRDEIIADSVEQKSIDEIFSQGFDIKPCEKGSGSVRFGINKMLEYRLHYTPRSANIQKEFYTYSWRKDKNGNMLQEPVKEFDHALDAARYRVTTRAQPVHIITRR